jgi:hypothetical protein
VEVVEDEHDRLVAGAERVDEGREHERRVQRLARTRGQAAQARVVGGPRQRVERGAPEARADGRAVAERDPRDGAGRAAVRDPRGQESALAGARGRGEQRQ